MNLSVVPAEGWYIAPEAAWMLVIVAVGAASALLGYLNSLTRYERTQPPKGDEPTRHYDKAA